MALPLPPGLTPSEVAFMCEMESVTVVPRQRLDSLELIGGNTPNLQPPQRSAVPLWLALLLKRQRRANILPPPWLHPVSLGGILEFETTTAPETFSPAPPLPENGDETTSPPFLKSSTHQAPADALPYHWLEVGEILLDAAQDDLVDPNATRRLMRDLREVRMAKIRAGVPVLDASGVVTLNGVGGMEVCEARTFVCGVVDGLRKITASREQARGEQDGDGDENYDTMNDDDET